MLQDVLKLRFIKDKGGIMLKDLEALSFFILFVYFFFSFFLIVSNVIIISSSSFNSRSTRKHKAENKNYNNENKSV